MTTPKQIIGSISSGTMRTKDLIPRFLDTLGELDSNRARELRQEWAAINDQPEDNEDDLSMFLNETLFDVLNEYAPPYFYFGAHPGDGADYGFWLSEDVQREVKDNGGMVADDLESVPADFSGEVLHVNDHGNATLYVRDEGSEVWREVWSVV